MSTRDLVFDIFAIDRASAVFSRVGAEADAMGGRVGKGSRLAGDALLVAGSIAVGLGVKSVMMASQFDAAITRLHTSAAEAPGNLKMVSQGLLDMAGQVGYSAKQLVQGMYFVESGGFHGARGLQVLSAAAKGAKTENASLIDVSRAVVALLHDYQGTSLTAAQATNMLVATTAHGVTTFQELAHALPNIGPVAASAHISISELGGALATITSNGTDASTAATYLRQTIGHLAVQTPKAAAEMAGLGISSLRLQQTLTSGSGHGLIDAIQMLYNGIQKHLVGGGLVSVDTFKKMTKSTTEYQRILGGLPAGTQTAIGAIANMSGGVKNMMGVLMLGGAHLNTFRDDTAAVTAQLTKGGATVAGFSDVQKTLAFQMDATKGKAGALGIEIGQRLEPAFRDALGVADGFLGFLSSHLDTVIAVGGAVALLATDILLAKGALLLWAGAQAAWDAATAIGAWISLAGGIGSARDAMALLSLAWEASPVGVMAGVIAGVAGAAYLLYRAFDSGGPAIKINQQEIDGLKLSYDKLTGAIKATGAEQIKQNLQATKVTGTVYAPSHGGTSRAIRQEYGNAIQAARDLGIQESALQLALMGNRHEMDFVTTSLQKLAHGNTATAAEARGLLSALHLNQAAIVQSGRAQMVASNQAAVLGSALAKVPGYYDLVNHATTLNASMLAGLAEKYGWSSRQIATVLNTVMVPGGKRAVDAMIAQIDRLPPKLQGEAANALSAGQQIGNNFGAGVTQGIGGMIGSVTSAAANLVAQAVSAAKAHIKSHSPSQKTRDEIGVPFAQGIAVGMDSMHGHVANSSRRLIHAAHKAAMTALHVSNVELQAQLSADNSKLSKVNQQIAAAEAWGKAFEGNVFSASLTLPSTSRKMMVNGTPVTITDSGQGITAKSSPAQVFAAMMSYQTGQAKEAATLARDIAHLRREGVSAAVLAQMQGAGANGIFEIGALAHATKRQVAAFDRLVAYTQSSLDNTGAFATSGKAMQTLQHEKNRDAREVANIKRALHGLKLTIANGGATLRPA